MFTGLVEEVGALEGAEPREAGSRLRIRASVVTGDLNEGDSVLVNGVCLTAVDIRKNSFGADVSPETLKRSTLGGLRPGSELNLERALAAGGRLGGHIVQGHADGVGEIVSVERLGAENWWLRVRVPAELERYLVFKGSVAIDGISLTVAEVTGDQIAVAIIPHTWDQTNLRTKKPGDTFNIETDVLAKYVEKMLAALDLKPKLSVAKLIEQGY